MATRRRREVGFARAGQRWTIDDATVIPDHAPIYGPIIIGDAYTGVVNFFSLL